MSVNHGCGAIRPEQIAQDLGSESRRPARTARRVVAMVDQIVLQPLRDGVLDQNAGLSVKGTRGLEVAFWEITPQQRAGVTKGRSVPMVGGSYKAQTISQSPRATPRVTRNGGSGNQSP